jgi:hypothetical protein
MFDFILEHRDVIGVIIIGLVAFFAMGKKRATAILFNLLDESKDMMLASVEEDKEKYVQFIFNKLPKKAKVFITKKRISSILDEFLNTTKK